MPGVIGDLVFWQWDRIVRVPDGRPLELCYWRLFTSQGGSFLPGENGEGCLQEEESGWESFCFSRPCLVGGHRLPGGGSALGPGIPSGRLVIER